MVRVRSRFFNGTEKRNNKIFTLVRIKAVKREHIYQNYIHSARKVLRSIGISVMKKSNDIDP